MVKKIKSDKEIGPSVESKYKTKIKYYCPKRGWVTEEVEVVRYKKQEAVEQPKYTIADELSLDEYTEIFEESSDTVD